MFLHRTGHAAEILAAGFRDSSGFYMFSFRLTGVFVSDQALDSNEGANGESLLAVEVEESLMAPYELVDESGMMGYREWCVPAALLNGTGSVRLVEGDELEAVEGNRWTR